MRTGSKERDRDAPQELEDPLHPPDGHDLVLDLLPPVGDLARRERELADRARVVVVSVRVCANATGLVVVPVGDCAPVR
jgi:hypothetical protein